MEKNKEQLYGNEVGFFSKIFKEKQYNPIGWKLRLQREKNILLRLGDNQRLGHVLSLGCGDGHFELLLAPFAEKIIGLDISPEAIESARKSANDLGIKNVEFHLQPIEKIYEEEKFDVIVCLAFLHHVLPSDIAPLMHSIFAHLVEGGMFYSQDPNVHGFLRKIGHTLFPKWTSKFHSPDEYELDPKEMERTLGVVGFSDIKIGYNDLTLIPGLYVFKRRFSILMYFMLCIDWLWCHSPLAPWASCFYVSAIKKGDK